MRPLIRNLVSLLLCASIALAGSGFAGSYASALEHALGVEAELAQPGEAQDSGGERGFESHGCAAHLAVHLESLAAVAGPELHVDPGLTIALSSVVRSTSARPSPFFRPPRLLLA